MKNGTNGYDPAQAALPSLPPQVRVTKSEFMRTLRNFLLVELHIGRWRARTGLTMQDLGLPDDKNLDADLGSIIELGDKFLLPTIPQGSPFYNPKKPKMTYGQKLNAVESTARWIMRQRTVELYWGHGLPIAAFDEFDKEMRENYEKPFLALAEDLCGNAVRWQEHVDRLHTEYRNFAEDSARRFDVLRKSRGDFAPLPPEEFFERLWKSVSALIPTAKVFRESFMFQLDYAFIDWTPWADSSVKQRIIADLKGDAKTRAELQAFERAKATFEQIYEKKGAQAAALQDKMISDLARFMNGLVYQTLTECLESLNKNEGMIAGSVSNRLRKLWKTVSQYSVVFNSDERALADRLQELAVGGDITPDDIRKMMTAMATMTRATLLELHETPRAARELGVPDAPSFEEVRRARIFLDAPVYTKEGELVESRAARVL